MAAYIIARVKVTDREQYQEYGKLATAAIAKHGGKFLARGGEVATLEGDAETRRVVVIEFASVEQAKVFYNSPEYSAARKLRANAAVAEYIAVDGVPG